MATPNQASLRGFKIGQKLVHPTVGVVTLVSTETQTYDGDTLELLVLADERGKATIRVPRNKIRERGLRDISSKATVKKALAALAKKPKSGQGQMWSRRAKAFAEKLNSGDLQLVAEVARDTASRGIPISYSQQQIYEKAEARLCDELIAVTGHEGALVQSIICAIIAAQDDQAGAELFSASKQPQATPTVQPPVTQSPETRAKDSVTEAARSSSSKAPQGNEGEIEDANEAEVAKKAKEVNRSLEEVAKAEMARMRAAGLLPK